MNGISGYGSSSDEEDDGPRVIARPAAVDAPVSGMMKVKKLELLALVPKHIQDALLRGDTLQDSDNSDDDDGAMYGASAGAGLAATTTTTSSSAAASSSSSSSATTNGNGTIAKGGRMTGLMDMLHAPSSTTAAYVGSLSAHTGVRVGMDVDTDADGADDADDTCGSNSGDAAAAAAAAYEAEAALYQEQYFAARSNEADGGGGDGMDAPQKQQRKRAREMDMIQTGEESGVSITAPSRQAWDVEVRVLLTSSTKSNSLFAIPTYSHCHCH